MASSLDGIRVLELARYQAGPRAGMILSDLGAEVIKIEGLGGEQTRDYPPMVGGQSIYFAVYNRGKKSLCLDLRTPRGKQIFADLVVKSDIVLENFRPGVMDAMGFGYEQLRALNSGIILVSVSAFGQYGPYKHRPGFDPMGQAMSGLMSLTGRPFGQPVGTSSSIVDRVTALHATIGTLAALRHRERTGEGQVVDVCLLDSALTMVEIPTSYYLATGEEGGEDGRPALRCKDGWVVVAAAQKAMWKRLLLHMAADKADDPELDEASIFAGGSSKRLRILTEWCAERPVNEVCAELEKLDIPVGPVRTIPEVAKDEHLWEREILVKTEDPIAGEMYLPGTAMKLSGTPGRQGPVSKPGEHTDEILSGLLNLDADALRDLRDAAVIA